MTDRELEEKRWTTPPPTIWRGSCPAVGKGEEM